MDMGPSAALRIGDIRVVVSSHKAQLADQSMYRYVGIEPTEQSILVNQSSVHFGASGAVRGALPPAPGAWRWARWRRAIRAKPNGSPFSPAPPPRAKAPANG